MAATPNATSMSPSSSSSLLPADSPPSPLIDLAPPPPDSSLPPPNNTAPPPPDSSPPPPADSPPPRPSNASSLPADSPSPPPPPTDSSPPAASPPPPVTASSPTSVEPPPPPPFGSWSPPTPPAPPPPKRKHLSPPPPPNDMSPQPSNWSSNPTPVTPRLPSTPSWDAPPSRPSPPGSAYSDVANSIPVGNNSNGGSIQPGTAAGIGFGVGFAVLLAAIVIWCLKQPKKKSSEEYPSDYVRPSPIASSQTSGKYPSSSGSPYAKSPSVPLMKGNSDSHAYPYLQPDTGRGNVKSWFTYEELAEATDGFSHHNLLGEGGFGCVFKGHLTDGAVVAVKQLKSGGGQGEREFQAEIETISRVHHRHLVSLVGYCISDSQRLLVYEYLPNNTLHYHLHGHGRAILDWATRVRIAAGASRGLAYLHEDCHPRIIHRDIKSSNILLDENFEAQVADFGLARITADTNTHVSTRVMGTFGYLAPEYASSGKLTDRSDVFSFGVVLLEIITGRKPVDSSRPLGEESLVDWARPLLSHALETSTFDDIADPKLEKNYVDSEMFRMVEAAAACVRYNASMRPRMGRVMRALDALTDTDLDNGVKPGQSKAFDRAAKSDELKLFQKTAFGSQDYSSDFSRSSWRSRDL